MDAADANLRYFQCDASRVTGCAVGQIEFYRQAVHLHRTVQQTYMQVRPAERDLLLGSYLHNLFRSHLFRQLVGAKHDDSSRQQQDANNDECNDS